MPRDRKTKPGERDLAGGNLPRNIRWKADADFMDKLSPAEREWYDQFIDQMYSGDFKADEAGTWSKDQRKEAWSNQRASREDAFGLSGLAGGPDELPIHSAASDGKDWNHTPGYLEDPDYRAARDAFREHLTKQRRAIEPVQTPEYLKAKRRLSVVTPTAPADVVKPRRRKRKA